MTNDEIMQYYDYLMRLALSKCSSRFDAEDLVGDTLLAAFSYMHKGGIIEYPKTWLANTFYHKYNDNLRKKYRMPVTVSLDEGIDVLGTESEEYSAFEEEASKVRKELNHLSFITREVLIRFYFGDQSVADIAEGLAIPEGTVKSRLYVGRSQMKKGLETMETNDNYLPGQMHLSFGGMKGLKGEPISLVEGDLIAQNLLILAYEKPLTISELSKAISIPAAYIDPIVENLLNGELMVRTGSGKVYTDFIIKKPQNTLEYFKPQLDFAHRHFETIWSILRRMSERISKMSFEHEMGSEERTKLDRYAVLKALQDFQFFGTDKIEAPKFPNRRDGGRWFAQATAVDAGYNMKEYNEATEYVIHGGHRTTEALAAGGTRRVRLYEFDTTLFDDPHRYGFDHKLYFKYVIPLLWCIYSDIPVEEKSGTEIPNELLSHIPTLEGLGLIGNTHNKLCVKIPVLKKSEYNEMCVFIKNATEEIKSAIGEEFARFIVSMKTPVPKHLTSVPELFRYNEATIYFVMAIVREAYDKGLHLKDVDYCCPPVVLSYSDVE
ncbi:MAG: RNA polymerase sigma factor [Eubacterium sp.]|nr:RNA polymerase sigma factor [Eubacterium sp.]